MDTNISEEFYGQIVRLMPISCVDLFVEDEEGRILLIKRTNEPAKGQWWFPGGRVYFGETREDAAKRKLKEECGLNAESVKEIGTFDVILPVEGGIVHGVSTVYRMLINQDASVFLDTQSSEFDWRPVTTWLLELPDGFIKRVLKKHLA